MDFKTFKENVERWAEVRGIYEQSTESHQKAKALEEVGEYLTAKTDEERMDAIGDIAVCIVNAAKIKGLNIELNMKTVYPSSCISDIAKHVIDGAYRTALKQLSSFSCFDRCIEIAWNEIKDRKGMMVNSFYVKWENMTVEQREEFRLRDQNNTLLRQ